MRLIFATALLSYSAYATGLPTDDERFANWCSKFGRQYTSALEMAERKANWMMADAQILRMEMEMPDARFGHNSFSDWHPWELANLTGAEAPSDDGAVSLLRSDPSVGAMDLSLSFNWADPKDNKVGPVKNQGGCGSCWAFAASTQQEAYDQIKYGKPYVRHSEQEYVDCSAGSCGGGWMTQAWIWSRDNGVSAESDYRYVARNETCKHLQYSKVSHAANWSYISSTADAENYLKNVGPFSIALNAGNTYWYSYSGGVLKQGGGCPESGVDHAVVVVGTGYTSTYRTEYEKVPVSETCSAATRKELKDQSCNKGKTFKPETSECCEIVYEDRPVEVEVKHPYWIAQNSWGVGWGESGFIRLERTEGVGVCNMNQYKMAMSTRA